MQKKVDYLIVGQGLSGTFLAFQLLLAKKSFLIVDKGLENASSLVAAGLINPLALRRLIPSWRAGDFLTFNAPFYADIESFMGKRYFFNSPIDKLIASKDDALFWHHRFEKEELGDLMEKELKPINPSVFPLKNFLVGRVKQSSWVNISELLIDFRNYFLSHDLLQELPFEYNELTNNNCYQNISFKKIIFCEGARIKENPFFNYLPFGLNKGQLLTIESRDLPTESILKKKVFILPFKENLFKIGATFSWKWENENAELEKTLQLESFLKEITQANYKIVKEEAGIRPSVRDRRPLIGAHPLYKNFFIFNGMGAKGCLMAPLLINEFIAHLEYQNPLNPEVSLRRYDSYFS